VGSVQSRELSSIIAIVIISVFSLWLLLLMLSEVYVISAAKLTKNGLRALYNKIG